MKNSVFVLRADFGRYTSTFEKEGYIGIGWFDVVACYQKSRLV